MGRMKTAADYEWIITKKDELINNLLKDVTYKELEIEDLESQVERQDDAIQSLENIIIIMNTDFEGPLDDEIKFDFLVEKLIETTKKLQNKSIEIENPFLQEKYSHVLYLLSELEHVYMKPYDFKLDFEDDEDDSGSDCCDDCEFSEDCDECEDEAGDKSDGLDFAYNLIQAKNRNMELELEEKNYVITALIDKIKVLECRIWDLEN